MQCARVMHIYVYVTATWRRECEPIHDSATRAANASMKLNICIYIYIFIYIQKHIICRFSKYALYMSPRASAFLCVAQSSRLAVL